MFNTPCNVYQFATQVNIPIDMSCKTNFTAIMELINANNGFIYGSAVHKYLSKLNYHINDLDILFMSNENLIKFRDALTQLGNGQVRQQQIWEQFYTFSPALCKDVWTGTVQISNNSKLTIHAGILDTHQMAKYYVKYVKSEEPTKIYREDIVKILFRINFTDDFLCNFWMGNTIYRKLEDVVNVEIASYLMNKKANRGRYFKYSYRGVKLTSKDMSHQIAPSLTYLIDCKDKYRALGLVVIPLSRKDTELAGKAPSVSKWNTKDKSFDFKIYNQCTNIGLLCGPNSGIVCIDVDRKDNGVQMFNRLVQNYGPLPANCPIQSTGNNGFHYIFKYNPERMANMMPKIKCPKLYGRRPVGIDMWIQNCQFVASPSVNYSNGGKYAWIKPITSIDDIPEMPEWLYSLYETENITATGCIITNTPSKQMLPKLVDTESVDTESVDTESVDTESVDTESVDTESQPSLATIDDLSSIADSQETDSTIEEDSDYDLIGKLKIMIKHPEYALVLFLIIMLMSFMIIMLTIMALVAFYFRKNIIKYLKRDI